MKRSTISSGRHVPSAFKARILLLVLCLSNILCMNSQSGWTQHFWQGKPYWFNSVTGQSTWQDPSISQSIPQSPATNGLHDSSERLATTGRTYRPSRIVRSSGTTNSTAPSSSIRSVSATTVTSKSCEPNPNQVSTGSSVDVASALKIAQSRVGELQAALAEKDAALKAEQQKRTKAEENSTNVIDELTVSLQEVEDDYSELKKALAVEKQVATALESKIQLLTSSKQELREKADRLEKEQHRVDRLPQQLLARFLGGVAAEKRSSSPSALPVKLGSAKQSPNRTIALLRQNITVLLDKVVGRDETIRDLARQVAEYQQEDERRAGAVSQLQYRIREMFADRSRLLDLIDALSANLCDMAVKTSILQRFIEGMCSDFAARQARWEAEAKISQGVRESDAGTEAVQGEGGLPSEAFNVTDTEKSESDRLSTHTEEYQLGPAVNSSDVIDLDTLHDTHVDRDASPTLANIVLDDPEPEEILFSDEKSGGASPQ